MIKFSNTAAAGCELAEQLRKLEDLKESIVLAIASGGVFTAAAVACELKLPLELLFIRRLAAPLGPQKVSCAFSVGGMLVVDDELLPLPVNPVTGLDYCVVEGIEQIEAQACYCRGDRPPLNLSGTKVILVDNGIHTGGTMQIAIRALRKLGVTKITAATPVADGNSRQLIECLADEVVCLQWPEKFGHAGLWYEEFSRPTNDEILSLYLRSEETMNE